MQFKVTTHMLADKIEVCSMELSESLHDSSRHFELLRWLVNHAITVNARVFQNDNIRRFIGLID